MRTKPFAEYDPFAAVYNRHWGRHFIPLIMPVLETQVLNYLPPGAAILDLCCGTGQLARVLDDRGYNITGIDGSAAMLRYARQNAPEATLLRRDARSFRLPESFNAVISVFDSLNHILEPGELSAVFNNVRRALKPGGFFLFDLNMEPAYLADWDGNSTIVDEDMVCVLKESYEAVSKLASFSTTIFLEKNGWQRSDFTLTQRCYTAADVVGALEAAGFTAVEALAFDIRQDLTALTMETERGFFLCQKPL